LVPGTAAALKGLTCDVLGVERAGSKLGDHGRDVLGRVRVHLLAVEGQELQHGRQRDLLVAAPQRPLPHQRAG